MTCLIDLSGRKIMFPIHTTWDWSWSWAMYIFHPSTSKGTYSYDFCSNGGPQELWLHVSSIGNIPLVWSIFGWDKCRSYIRDAVYPDLTLEVNMHEAWGIILKQCQQNIKNHSMFTKDYLWFSTKDFVEANGMQYKICDEFRFAPNTSKIRFMRVNWWKNKMD